jgi:protein-tyrosine phosphatase
MIDIHSHILPNLDDGAQSLEESVSMAGDLKRLGFATIFATPHIYPGVYNNFKEGILDSFSIFKEQLAKRNIAVEVRPGAEVFITYNLMHAINCDLILTMNDQKKFILLELPFFEYPAYVDEVLFSLLARGIIPIISHPERNVQVQNISIVRELVEKGVRMQINISSFAGTYGDKVRNVAQTLLKEDLVHYLATDYHGRDGHHLEGGVDKLKVLIGKARLKKLLSENPRELIAV